MCIRDRPVPGRAGHLDEREGRGEDRRQGQRLDRGRQPQRRRGGPRDRLLPDARGHRVHVPRPGPPDRCPQDGDLRQAWRHPQLPDPDPDEAESSHRWLRAADLRVQLPRTDRQPARRGDGHPPSRAERGVLTMRVMAQLSMVMNLDKCIGCHTCSVTCKQAWTNRSGTEYVWFNNVETRPGQGYPRGYEDQEKLSLIHISEP